MLDATDEEVAHVKAYMASQAPDLKVTFLQKMHVENVLSHRHEVWDVHCDNKERWWVITNPTNLYSQEQFPNMDYAITFHVGLCLRIPRGEKQKLSDIPLEPFAACFRQISEATDALAEAQEVSDYQAIGVRCRESLLCRCGAKRGSLDSARKQAKARRPKGMVRPHMQHHVGGKLACGAAQPTQEPYQVGLGFQQLAGPLQKLEMARCRGGGVDRRACLGSIRVACHPPRSQSARNVPGLRIASAFARKGL
jgi:hypothetical protein